MTESPVASDIITEDVAPVSALATTATKRPSVGAQTAPGSSLTGRSPHIKTYRVKEVREAMASARRELGDDAILIQTKLLDPSQEDARYEVTFGVTGLPPNPEAAVAPIVEVPAKTPVGIHGSGGKPGFAQLREELAELHRMLSREPQNDDAITALGLPSVRLKAQLVQHGVLADVAAEWMLALEDSIASLPNPTPTIFTAPMLEPALRAKVRVDSTLGWDESQGKAILLIGPPASGKTTAVLKLALEYGIRRARSVEIWSLNPQSSGVDPATQSFTRLLNIPHRSFLCPRAVAASLSQSRPDDRLILIDGDGFGNASVDQDRELSTILHGSSPIDCQLVLSAAWHPTALRQIVDRFEVFQSSRLLFTMLDQACVFGPMLQEPWRSGKALSFFSEGPLGPGQIRSASLAAVLKSIDQSPID